MAETINLRLARKRAERARGEVEAAANRAKHGMARAEKKSIAAETAKVEKALDQAKREPD